MARVKAATSIRRAEGQKAIRLVIKYLKAKIIQPVLFRREATTALPLYRDKPVYLALSRHEELANEALEKTIKELQEIISKPKREE